MAKAITTLSTKKANPVTIDNDTQAQVGEAVAAVADAPATPDAVVAVVVVPPETPAAIPDAQKLVMNIKQGNKLVSTSTQLKRFGVEKVTDEQVIKVGGVEKVFKLISNKSVVNLN